MKKQQYPFSAIIGQQNFKLALLLNIIDPSIGGVLAIGDKGTGKTTLIRSLSELLSSTHQQYPFVNLPIGASEDRVLGHLNLEKLINDKQEQVVPGLLAKANKGCLYVDEINLLNDYLMDVLLDAAASGGYYLEREGLSAYLKSQFCLIGSMNPEEGELRPQLKDRFGLSVHIKTNNNAKERLQIIKNRIQFDDGETEFISSFEEQDALIVENINSAKAILAKVKLNDDIYEYVANLVIQHQVEGHRADILLIKTARAYAAYLGELEVMLDHVEAIQNFVLAHRSNQSNAQQQASNPQNNDTSSNQESPSHSSSEENSEDEQHQQNQNHGGASLFSAIQPQNDVKVSKASSLSKKGSLHTVNTQQQGLQKVGNHKIDITKTVRNYVTTDVFELQHKTEINATQKHIIFLLDASGSMLKERVVAYAKGMIQKIVALEKVYKPLFSLVSIVNNETHTLVSNDMDSSHILSELDKLETGGKTYMIPAFQRIKALASQANQQTELIIITDGKFSSEKSENAFEEAVLGFKMYCKGVNDKKVIDAEKGVVKLALAKKFAAKINANYEPLMCE